MSDVFAAIKCFFAMSMLHSVVSGLQDLGEAKPTKSSRALSYSSHLKHDSDHSQAYSPWSEWSPCSRTCGTGVTSRQRTCHSKFSQWRDESCSESTEYKTCKLIDCSTTEDYRTIQCSQYNNRRVAGQNAKSWVATKPGTNPCELRCESEDRKMVYGFGKVEDGTPCLKDGVCLDGRCLEISCDQRLGSHARFDMCGVCEGRNATCVHYKDIFNGQPNTTQFPVGRHAEVLVLPNGAMNFELRNTVGNNVLGMRDFNVAIVFYHYRSAETSISGTVVKYSKEDFNRTEVLRLKGPTKTRLSISVLLQETNPGIRYEYWLQQDSTLRTRPTQQTRPYHNTPSAKPVTSKPTMSTPEPYKRTRNTFKPYKQLPAKQINDYYGSFSHVPNSNNVVYGPKRRVYVPPINDFIKFDKPTEKPVHESTTQSGIFNSVPLPSYNLNYKTPKPVFNYYEKYRNSSSYQAPVNIYRNISSVLQKQVKSGAIDESGVLKGKEQTATATDIAGREREVQKDAGFNSQQNLEGIEKLSSRWEYKINGNEKSDGFGKSNHFPTPISISVLPLPESRNYTKTRRGKRRGKNHTSRSVKGGSCEPCQRIRDQKKHFCSSDFVIRASVLGSEYLHGETRYEVEVLQSFKNNWGLLPREYIWSLDTCDCPRLRIGKEYLIMGKSDDNYRKTESRLMIDRTCFVRVYNSKFTRRLNRLKRDQAKKCRPRS